MNKKYTLTDETIVVDGHILYRIRARQSFSNIKAGDFGGFIEYTYNLSHKGNCWVDGKAQVYGYAWVHDNARVFGDAQVFDDARVFEDAMVFGNSQVFGDAWVGGKVQIYGNAHVCGDIQIHGRAKLDSGIWNQEITIDDRYYLISTTLKKILLWSN